MYLYGDLNTNLCPNFHRKQMSQKIVLRLNFKSKSSICAFTLLTACWSGFWQSQDFIDSLTAEQHSPNPSKHIGVNRKDEYGASITFLQPMLLNKYQKNCAALSFHCIISRRQYFVGFYFHTKARRAAFYRVSLKKGSFMIAAPLEGLGCS